MDSFLHSFLNVLRCFPVSVVETGLELLDPSLGTVPPHLPWLLKPHSFIILDSGLMEFSTGAQGQPWWLERGRERAVLSSQFTVHILLIFQCFLSSKTICFFTCWLKCWIRGDYGWRVWGGGRMGSLTEVLIAPRPLPPPFWPLVLFLFQIEFMCAGLESRSLYMLYKYH